MKLAPMTAVAAIAAAPVLADDTRHVDAHEHGVGELNIAVDGNQIAMEFHAPGADIVGFEHPANSAGDIAAIEAALSELKNPLALFKMPEAAHCSLVEATAELEDEHDDHDDHDDHEGDHADHDDHDDHDDHAEEDEGQHTEFHAEYLLNCDKMDALDTITFAYFAKFENALEVEVQLVSMKGVIKFEVERDAPVLSVKGHI